MYVVCVCGGVRLFMKKGFFSESMYDGLLYAMALSLWLKKKIETFIMLIVIFQGVDFYRP